MRTSRGFTLVELMIVVVIAAVLAAVAYPAYQNYAREARRADAHAALLQLANDQEKFYAANNRYAANITELTGTGTFLSNEGYYSLATASANTASDFTLTASAVAGTSQAEDDDPTDCTAISITSANQRAPGGCWGR